MSRRRHRTTRNRACTGKKAHPTRDAALTHLHRLRRAGDTRLTVYHCRHCTHWHVGHAPRTR